MSRSVFRVTSAGLAVLVVLAALAACGGRPAATPTTPAKAQPPKAPGQILASPLASPLTSPLTKPGAAQTPGLTGRIVYHSRAGDGKYHIEVINADGSGMRSLTEASAGDDVEPAWSPDGKRVAFGSDREGGNFDIYVINADGSGIKRLTDDPGYDWGPSWSRDGKQILFTSNRAGSMRLYIMNADGSDQRPLLEGKDGEGWAAVWSPKRDEIAFVSERNGKSDIYLLDVAAKQVNQLTKNDLLDDRPAWSPDGEQIAYMGSKENTVVFDPDEIWVIGRNGGTPRQLTDNLDGDIIPTWSPDGKWIAFSSSRDGGWYLYVMPAGGGEARRLTQGKAAQRSARWGP